MTLRRLWVLILSLIREDTRLVGELHAAEEKAKKPTVDRIRERQAYYDARKKGA